MSSDAFPTSKADSAASANGPGSSSSSRPASSPAAAKARNKLNGMGNIDFILDIPLQVTVRLGCARLPISDLLELGGGSVVELDRIAGEPLEVLINNKLVARGEAVVINDKYGVRLTEIVSPTERILGLKS
jgi:flagellar motor switch protein FliN/FliY